MSQVTEQSVRFQTALASIKLIQASAVLDLTENDFDFLTSNKVWIATDRSRARRCVEACVYGTLDFVGYPRFPAPVEFIAAVIAYYVHPVNIQTACLIMEGALFLQTKDGIRDYKVTGVQTCALPISLGSVKTNIGHLDAAAGIAGLIKTVLALHHKLLPPSLHFETPNPLIDFANSPFYVNTRSEEHTSELQSPCNLVCRLLLEKKKTE